MQFKTLTGHDPYPHQIETYDALPKIRVPLPLRERVRVRGNYVILRAPTGSGKSEAVFVPFVDMRGKSLPKRMIYAPPVRDIIRKT